MTTNYPTTKDDGTSLPVEAGSTALSTNHVANHTNSRDAIIALQTKVGVDGSAVTTSHDYKLGEVTSTDKAVGKTASQTIANKTLGTGTKITLGSDATGDTYYRDASGNFQRLAKGNTNDILTQGATIPEWVANPATTDATESDRGVVEIATQVEVDAGTDVNGTNQLVVEPSKVRAKKYHDYALATGSANAYVLDVSPSITAYATGQEFTFEANHTNTGSATLNIDTLGAKTIKFADGSSLGANTLISGGVYKVVYDGTDLILQGLTNLGIKKYSVTLANVENTAVETNFAYATIPASDIGTGDIIEISGFIEMKAPSSWNTANSIKIEYGSDTVEIGNVSQTGDGSLRYWHFKIALASDGTNLYVTDADDVAQNMFKVLDTDMNTGTDNTTVISAPGFSTQKTLALSVALGGANANVWLKPKAVRMVKYSG